MKGKLCLFVRASMIVALFAALLASPGGGIANPQVTQPPGISGRVLDPWGRGLEGAEVKVMPSGLKVLTSSTGAYFLKVPSGFTGSVTVTKRCLTFSPPSRTYRNVTSPQPNQDFTSTRIIYTASGIIKDPYGFPVPGVALTGLYANVTVSGVPPTTAADGSYSGYFRCDNVTTVTPTLAGYVFNPPTRQHFNANAPNMDYAAVPKPKISGRIASASGMGLAGVTMGGLPAGTVTDANGNYSGEVMPNWTGAVTPAKASTVFTPPSKSYANITYNQTNQNYQGTPTYVISGKVLDGQGAAIAGVQMIGLPGNPLTAADGSYTGTVVAGWTGSVSPVKASYYFNPGSKAYNSVNADQTAQDFLGGTQLFKISGNITTSDVTLRGFPSDPTTGSSNYYEVRIPSGWSGTVTPVKANYFFTPASRTYTNVTADMPFQNYAPTVQTYIISGQVRTVNGPEVYTNVVWEGAPSPATYDADGTFRIAVPYMWSGTLRPASVPGRCLQFTPASRSYSYVGRDQTGQNFDAVGNMIVITGKVVDYQGNPVAGVVMNGIYMNPVTGPDGTYTTGVTLTCPWSGTITPILPNTRFDPPSRTYSSITASQINQDYRIIPPPAGGPAKPDTPPDGSSRGGSERGPGR